MTTKPRSMEVWQALQPSVRLRVETTNLRLSLAAIASAIASRGTFIVVTLLTGIPGYSIAASTRLSVNWRNSYEARSQFFALPANHSFRCWTCAALMISSRRGAYCLTVGEGVKSDSAIADVPTPTKIAKATPQGRNVI